MMTDLLFALGLGLGVLAFCTSAAGQEISAREISETGPRGITQPAEGFFSNVLGDVLPGHWVMDGSLGITQILDDNVFLANSFRKSDELSRFTGSIRAGIQGKRNRFELSYTPEYTLYKTYPDLSTLSQRYTQAYSHLFSGTKTFEWSTELRRFGTHNSLPFSTVNFFGETFSFFNPQELENGVEVSTARSLATVTSRIAPHSRLRMTVGGGVTSFATLGPAPPSLSSRASYFQDFELSWQHDLSRTRSIGVETTASYFGFVAPNRHQWYETAKVRITQQLPWWLTVSAAVGPSFQEISSALRPSYTFDISVERNTKSDRVSLRIDRVLQTGFLTDSLTTLHGALQAEHRFSHNLFGSGFLGYGSSSSLLADGKTMSASGDAQLGYRLSSSLTAYLSGGRTQQKSTGSIRRFRTFDVNQYTIGLQYNVGWLSRR